MNTRSPSCIAATASPVASVLLPLLPFCVTSATARAYTVFADSKLAAAAPGRTGRG
jgi:hypothetical protein